MSDASKKDSVHNILMQFEKQKRIEREPIMFDVVSTQFAVHYMFESDTSLRSYLHNVSQRLETGGTFIGTKSLSHALYLQ